MLSAQALIELGAGLNAGQLLGRLALTHRLSLRLRHAGEAVIAHRASGLGGRGNRASIDGRPLVPARRRQRASMRLTVYTDYALRVLMYLAIPRSRLATISEIASSYGVSRNHLMKVVYELGVAGYIETMRGQNGGMRLARTPGEIRIGEVVRRTEPDLALVPCFDPVNAVCAITPACKLRRALHRAREAFLAVLDEYTLADLADNPAALADLLSPAPANS
ncbi:MAG TPA: Rrf2 family transcriptional regulator [Caulobacteraceae bacterium]|nr:Rrf2 family transcriptional regulator [Caulobacteraceae bacterium]